MWGKKVLSEELKKYGYVFSMKKHLLMYAAVIFTMLLLGHFFQMNLPCQVILCSLGCISLPFFIRNTMKNKYEQKRFSDINIYMEQFLYSFQKTQKVLSALEDTLVLFEKGRMYRTLEHAIYHIQHTYLEADVEATALKMIEEKYPGDGIHMLHQFVLSAEKLGGDCDKSIALLLDYRRMWADRVYELLQEQKKSRREVILSILTSLLLCSVIYFIGYKLNLNLGKNPFTSIVTMIVLVLDLYIFYQADKKLSVTPLKKYQQNDKEMQELWDRYDKYNSKNLFHVIGKKIAAKNLIHNIEKEFPRWLMEISLLLQTENVSVAILKSYKYAPAVIKPALEKMIGEMKMHPEAIQPYLDFLSEFTLPEIRSSMKMLYSISSGYGGDATIQISDIIRRNQLMMDKSQRIANEDSLSGMYVLFLAPQLTGGAKLIMDLILLFVVYLGHAWML